MATLRDYDILGVLMPRPRNRLLKSFRFATICRHALPVTHAHAEIENRAEMLRKLKL